MDQTRALNSLAPFIALAKAANSPRAAADLVTQATSAANTYVFAELLEQANIQALATSEQYAGYLHLLQIFAWGTWESYKCEHLIKVIVCANSGLTKSAAPGLPPLSDAQATKLRLLSLLNIAAHKDTGSASNLTYKSLCQRLDLSSSIDLEHLVTEAIYNDLIVATLDPASQIVVITSVAPLRDVAPGSVQTMIAELAQWSGRCHAVLADLEAEIQKIKADAERKGKRQDLAKRQAKAIVDHERAKMADLGAVQGFQQQTRTRRDIDEFGHDDEDAMDVDCGSHVAGGGKKKAAGGRPTRSVR